MPRGSDDREETGARPYCYEYSKGQTYYLRGKEVTLQNGRRQRIFYFARKVKAEALDALPAATERTMRLTRSGDRLVVRGAPARRADKGEECGHGRLLA